MDLVRFEKIGLDTDGGLAFCADDPEFYAEMLEEYASGAAAAVSCLEQASADGDWGAYAICVHALKSSSKIIGAGHIAELACELEVAAKNGDGEKISGMHAGFIDAFSRLTEQICEIMK